MKTIYYNPQCSKCRIASKTLDEKGVEYEIYEYLEKGVTEDQVKEILKKGNLSIDDILRRTESEYKEHIQGKNLSDTEKIRVLIEHPKLLQRPIVVDEDSAHIARDEDGIASASK